jgi:hypothetical protein
MFLGHPSIVAVYSPTRPEVFRNSCRLHVGVPAWSWFFGARGRRAATPGKKYSEEAALFLRIAYESGVEFGPGLLRSARRRPGLITFCEQDKLECCASTTWKIFVVRAEKRSEKRSEKGG